MRRTLLVTTLAAACGGPSTPPAAGPAAGAGPGDHAGHAGHAGHAHHGGHDVGSGHHRFDDAERWAKVFDDPARDAWQKPDHVVALLGLSPGQTVVDLGAGTGYFVGRLAAAVGPGGTVIPTDVEADMVRYLEERGQREGWANVRPALTPMDDPALPATSVDRVLVVDVWHHLGDRQAYAGKLAKALRPGGFVQVVDFTLDSPHGPPAAMRLAPEAIAADLTAAGLRAEIVADELPHQYVVVGRR